MKFIVVFVAILACVAAYEVDLLTEEQWENFMQDESEYGLFEFCQTVLLKFIILPCSCYTRNPWLDFELPGQKNC